MATVSLIDVGVLFVIVVTASLASGFSVNRDVTDKRDMDKVRQDTLSAGPSPACPDCELSVPSRRRVKRCTCYTYKDKECVYYCHLDIIWINTPEHTVQYGMSSYQSSSRVKRHVGAKSRIGPQAQRCVCSLSSDIHCKHFCTARERGPPLDPTTKPFNRENSE